eukprot:443021-Pleurochrysis_carterae.AAC.1
MEDFSSGQRLLHFYTSIVVQIRQVRKVGNALPINLNAHRLHTLVGGLVLLAALWREHVKTIAFARGVSWLAADSA